MTYCSGEEIIQAIENREMRSLGLCNNMES